MAKGKTATIFFCQNCGHESTKWMGQCPACKEWNTFVEETVSKSAAKASGSGGGRVSSGQSADPCVLAQVMIQEESNLLTGIG